MNLNVEFKQSNNFLSLNKFGRVFNIFIVIYLISSSSFYNNKQFYTFKYNNITSKLSIIILLYFLFNGIT